MSARSLGNILKGTLSRWNSHEGQRLGAALAFYTVLSVAPLFVFLLTILSAVFNRASAERSLLHSSREVLGPSGMHLARTFLDQVRNPEHGLLANVIAAVVLLFSASSVFGELRDDLNKMWDARPREQGLTGLVLQKLFSFVLVLAAGVLVAASMLATASLSIAVRYVQDAVPLPPALLEAVNNLASLAILSLIFALVYRFVPDRRLPWPVLWAGATVSAVLFVLGKVILGVYLRHASVGSAYGAAGSVIAFALWLYYSAQIFLLGAEFTYVWGKGTSRLGD